MEKFRLVDGQEFVERRQESRSVKYRENILAKSGGERKLFVRLSSAITLHVVLWSCILFFISQYLSFLRKLGKFSRDSHEVRIYCHLQAHSVEEQSEN